MLRKALRFFGIIKTTIGLTLISVLLSVGISLGINALLNGGTLGKGLAIAILTPAVITPVMAVKALRLLSHLDAAEQRLQILSDTDELTQTYNRRFFIQVGEQELKRALRYGGTFAIAILDLDNFKEINDRYGHLVGDQVLRELCRLLGEHIRQVDIFARYGGDEFIFLFPQVNRAQAQACVERIFGAFAGKPIKIEGLEVQSSFSIGVAVFIPNFEILDDLLKQADSALYQVKKSGGNGFLLA